LGHGALHRAAEGSGDTDLDRWPWLVVQFIAVGAGDAHLLDRFFWAHADVFFAVQASRGDERAYFDFAQARGCQRRDPALLDLGRYGLVDALGSLARADFADDDVDGRGNGFRFHAGFLGLSPAGAGSCQAETLSAKAGSWSRWRRVASNARRTYSTSPRTRASGTR